MWRHAWLLCLVRADESLFVRHPTVYDVPRSFDMCLQEIYVKDAPRTVRFRANETALTCAARSLSLIHI